MSNSWTLQRDTAVRVLRPEGAVYETAAAQLLHYLNALCGITEARSQSAPAIILRTDPSMPPDAFRLVVRGSDLHLVGQNGRGVLYAVFALAERFGCNFFAHDTEVIPHPAELSLPDGLDVTEASPFAYRDLYWIGTTDPLTAVKLRINGTGLKSGQHIRHLTAEVGGGIGYALKTAISQGAKRGLFSNEAGMGSTPHAHALAKVEKPQDQGITAMVGVFLTTFVILTLTALVILSTGATASGLTGAALSQYAFATVFGKAGNVFIALCMLFFAFSTIVGWYLFGQMNVKALLGERAVKPYALLAVVFIAVGACLKVQLVWDAADLFNGLMVLPNLLALLALSKLVVSLERACDADEAKAGTQPVPSACEE